jgi:hypothetical protein
MAARVALCTGAGRGLEAAVAALSSSAGGSDAAAAALALAAAEAPAQCVAGVKRVGGFCDAWTDAQLLALCRAAPPANAAAPAVSPAAAAGGDEDGGGGAPWLVEASAPAKWRAQHKAPLAAAHCANAAPPHMAPAEKVALCASAPASADAPWWPRVSDGSSGGLGPAAASASAAVPAAAATAAPEFTATARSASPPGSAAAACAHKAGRFLRDGGAKAALCAGARDLGPAECAAAAPFTMAPRLKVRERGLCNDVRRANARARAPVEQSLATPFFVHISASRSHMHCATYVQNGLFQVALCSGAPAGGAPGRCAALVRAASAASALVSYREPAGSSSSDVATVPLPPSPAAAAGMEGGAPADYW